ncbi:SsgA family sporulation/cell division regulator [Protofrankia sp. BMG5.30]|uniref:Sporulation and cell division protein SsgA n=3 Tax=Protofrankia TaxID=2994361 RepID=F8AYY8_9ACTN|nr:MULTISPECIES: SsgA family sporulation/cell division regulator [Protofrankia]AEH09576.1 sporulation and cell division protein SsgA [Candidatus Protofrankia datiscae]KLL11076.1 cell division protein [Protofrankia coriariae]ONH34700.1 cell division protein [Protofrankia sp. BMG5.30]
MQVEDVTTELVVDDAPSRGRLTVLQVNWRRADPLAVTLELISRPDHPALPRGTWVVLRDALRAGLDVPTGTGDVRITPEPERGCIRLDLTAGELHSAVRLSMDAARAFLDATERVVPRGQERAAEELDAVLANLLEN